MFTISAITKIVDVQGQYGPQKQIFLKDNQGRSMAGFVKAEKFNPQEWQPGMSIEAEVVQNGKYTNFKYKGGSQSQSGQQYQPQYPQTNGEAYSAPPSSPLVQQAEMLLPILNKLDLLQATVIALGLKLDRVLPHLNLDQDKNELPPFEGDPTDPF